MIKNSSMADFETQIKADLDEKKKDVLDRMFKDMTGVGDDPLPEEDEGKESDED